MTGSTTHTLRPKSYHTSSSVLQTYIHSIWISTPDIFCLSFSKLNHSLTAESLVDAAHDLDLDSLHGMEMSFSFSNCYLIRYPSQQCLTPHWHPFQSAMMSWLPSPFPCPIQCQLQTPPCHQQCSSLQTPDVSNPRGCRGWELAKEAEILTSHLCFLCHPLLPGFFSPL